MEICKHFLFLVIFQATIGAALILAPIFNLNAATSQNATSTVQVTVCGNNIIESGEYCDDGVDNKTYVYGINPRYCNIDCLNYAPACGDSVVQTGFGEICDEDTQSCSINGYNGIQSCNDATCAAWLSCIATESCGDGIKNGSEVCDSDTLVCAENGYHGSKSCETDCSGYGVCVISESCGDLIINGNEICDDNTQNCAINSYNGTQSCNGTCSGWNTCAPTEFCGDSIKNGAEECDGGANCSTSCQITVSSGGSSGGGGGGGATQTTKVILQGRAYPSSTVTILKDGQIATVAKADNSANFKAEITNITAGVWTFGIWSEDKYNNKSITFSFTATVVANMTTSISGIFLPPTIQIDKNNVKKGDILNIIGQTAPQTTVELTVNSEEPITVGNINPDTQGVWFHAFDTSELEYGNHTTRAKATAKDDAMSSYSNSLSFTVGNVSAFCSKNPDINNDKRINLVDFSILLYNWGIPKKIQADINCDRKVNLVDFSILMYYWTG